MSHLKLKYHTFVNCRTDPFNVIFLSTNFGITWAANIVGTNFSGPWNAVACSADGLRIFAASTNGPIAISSDAGKNWVSEFLGYYTSTAVSADGTQFLSADDNAVVWYWTYGSAFRNAADLGLWQGSPLNTAVAMSADGSRMYAGVEHYGLYTILTNPPSPMLMANRGPTNLTLLWPYPGNNLVLQASTNPAGKSWTNVQGTPVLNLSKVENQLEVLTSGQPTFFRLASYQERQGSFQDLDFEAAKIVSEGQPSAIDFAVAFPGWTGYSGTNAAKYALYNTIALDSAAFGLQSNSLPSGWDGNYYATIQSGFSLQGPQLGLETSYLTQTGYIPRGINSLSFKAQGSNYVLSLNGQALNVISLGGNLYGANIAAFAGTTAELRFTVLLTPSPQPPINTLYLDSIQFSTRPVP